MQRWSALQAPAESRLMSYRRTSANSIESNSSHSGCPHWELVLSWCSTRQIHPCRHPAYRDMELKKHRKNMRWQPSESSAQRNLTKNTARKPCTGVSQKDLAKDFAPTMWKRDERSMGQQKPICYDKTRNQATEKPQPGTQTQARMWWRKSTPKASSDKDKSSIRQQESGGDDNTFKHTTIEAPDRYKDTGKHVIKRELAKGQL